MAVSLHIKHRMTVHACSKDKWRKLEDFTSCLPQIRLRYQSIEKRRDIEAEADCKSFSFSNKGTTRRGLGIRHSRCKSSTISTSDGAVAMEMTYAPKQSDGSSATTRSVSRTSLTSSVMGRSAPKRGRFPRSSDTSHSWQKWKGTRSSENLSDRQSWSIWKIYLWFAVWEAATFHVSRISSTNPCQYKEIDATGTRSRNIILHIERIPGAHLPTSPCKNLTQDVQWLRPLHHCVVQTLAGCPTSLSSTRSTTPDAWSPVGYRRLLVCHLSHTASGSTSPGVR